MNGDRKNNTVSGSCERSCAECRMLTEEEIIRFSEEAGQKVIRQGGRIALDGRDTLQVHWRITNQCNFRCSYCFSAGLDHRQKVMMPSFEQVRTAIKNLAAANRTHYQVGFVGGEPTTYPFLIETILYFWTALGEKLESVAIITNGSFSNSQIEALSDIGRFVDIHLNVSVHAEFSSMEHLSKLVKKLSSFVRLNFKVMLHPLYFEKIKSMVDELSAMREEYEFSLEIGLLRRPPDFVFDDDRYTQEHYDYYFEAPKRFMQAAANGASPNSCRKRIDRAKGWTLYLERNVGGRIEYREGIGYSELRTLTDSYALKGMICCAGTNRIDIFVDGTCRGVVCGKCKPGVNIYKYDPFLVRNLIEGVKCEKSRCGNSANCNIPKFLLPDEAETFIEAKRAEQTALTEEWLRTHGGEQK